MKTWLSTPYRTLCKAFFNQTGFKTALCQGLQSIVLMAIGQAVSVSVCRKLLIRFFRDGSLALGNILKRFLVVAHIRIVGNDRHEAV